jgi:hypothetical protein
LDTLATLQSVKQASAATEGACRGPLSERETYVLILAVGRSGIPYDEIAAHLKLRDSWCVYHLAGGLPPEDCSGSCGVAVPPSSMFPAVRGLLAASTEESGRVA